MSDSNQSKLIDKKLSKAKYDKQYYLKHRQKILNRNRKLYLKKVAEKERLFFESMKSIGLIDDGIKNGTIYFD